MGLRAVFEVSPFLDSWKQLHGRMDLEGLLAWRRTLDDAKKSTHEFGYQNKTGWLTASGFWYGSKFGRFEYFGEIGWTAEYAAWVNSPTGTHFSGSRYVIRPKKAGGMLRWFSHGAPVFARSVMHPGSKGAGFTGKAAEEFTENIAANVGHAFDIANR